PLGIADLHLCRKRAQRSASQTGMDSPSLASSRPRAMRWQPCGNLNQRGVTVTVLLDPADENTRTNIETALTARVLHRNGMGSYREAYSPHAPTQAPVPQQPTQQPEQDSPMAPEDQIISSVSNNLGVAWQGAAASILTGEPAGHRKH